MDVEQALQLDMVRNMVGAAEAYEHVLQADPANLSVLLNLLAIYWQSTDYGISASLSLPVEFIVVSGQRLSELMSYLKERYSDDPAAQFWTMYVGWTDYGGELDLELCRRLLKDYPSYLEPVMPLYMQGVDGEFGEKVDRLRNDCRTNSTERCRYIASVLTSHLNLDR